MTPHIIEGDQIVTGDREGSDSEYKSAQEYSAFDKEGIELKHKTYRDYKIIEVPVDQRPEIKPARNF